MPTAPFSFTGQRVPAGATVVGFRGREAISKPYEYEVFLAVPEGAVGRDELRAALSTRATLAIHRDDGEVRRVVHGVLASIGIVRALPGGASLVRATLVPALARLAHARRNRVWVGEALPDILRGVFRECGLGESDVEFRLENPARYGALEHACQYRETHLDFVSRRMESEGIYYHFEHPEGGASELLVVTDSRSFLTPLSDGGVRFVPVDDDDTSAAEGLWSFSFEYSAVPSGARARGGDYLRPDLDVSGASAGALESAFVFNHLDAARDPRDVARIARVRAEEHLAHEAVVRGEGRSYELCAGYSFDLEDHATLAGEYLVTALRAEGYDLVGHPKLAARLGFRGLPYHAEFDAIPANVQYRPRRVTPRPSAQGMEPGVVQGAPEGSDPGRYAHLDEHGRYLVRLRFDDGDPKAQPSVRMRMAQAHAGAGGAGIHFPLRDGAEVLVGFVRGDPDQPYIAAAVPDASTQSPVTQDNATKNVIHTGGGNQLIMEDREGAEYIKWKTPYNNTVFHLGAPHNPQYAFELVTAGNGLIRTGKTDAGTAMTTTGVEDVEPLYGEAHLDPEKENPTVGTQGLGILVAGDKVERVKGRNTEVYGTTDNTKDVVHSVWVHGNTSQTVHGDKTDLTRGNTVDTADKDRHNITRGNTINEHYGAKTDTVLGASTSLAVGAKTDVALAVKTAVNLGASTTITAGVKLDYDLILKIAFLVGGTFNYIFGYKYEEVHGANYRLGKAAIDRATLTLKQATAAIRGLAAIVLTLRVSPRVAGVEASDRRRHPTDRSTRGRGA